MGGRKAGTNGLTGCASNTTARSLPRASQTLDAIHAFTYTSTGCRSDTMDDIGAKLRAGGVKPTRQRLEIARVLFSSVGHLSADRILALVNERRPATSKATVYNTLKLFLARGLIRAVIADPNKVFYDANTAPNHHFYDVRSGELIDIAANDVAVTGLPPLPEGCVAEGVDIVIRIRRDEAA